MAEIAKPLPKTLVMLLPISQKWSIGRINAIPSTGMLNMEQVAATTTKEARGTPAIPFEVSIKTSNMVN